VAVATELALDGADELLGVIVEMAWANLDGVLIIELNVGGAATQEEVARMVRKRNVTDGICITDAPGMARRLT